MLMFLTYLPLSMSTNTSHVIVGEDADIDDIPRHLQQGRKHCFMSPLLYCRDGKRCCTHVHQKKIWCCDRQHKCGKAVKTCVIP